MSDEFDAVLGTVRERVRPDAEERGALRSAVEAVIERTEAAVADLPVEATVMQVGSTARDTWLAGERDIDVFVRFPPDLDRDELESYGLEVGHAVLPDGREEFAEHPYVVGEYDGFGVDLVPCYGVDQATDIKSAVDRTPFHTRHMVDRLDGDLADDVRVCKQFCTAIGVYGSDLRTRGFSGLLVELLVLEHGSFRALIEAGADWRPPVRIDPAGHGNASFEDPLVVIDPTDPERNVAAVLSADNVARFQHFARELLAEPRRELFDAPDPRPLAPAVVRDRFEDRGTTPVAVRFDTPDIVEDQLWPQLDRSLNGIAGELDRRGFDVFRTAAFAGTESVLLFELAVARRPHVERHDGPPVEVRSHATEFYDTYDGTADVYGPFIEGDRYVVERPREFTAAATLLASDAIFDVALGTHVESALEDGYDVLVGPEVGDVAGTFGPEFGRYLDPGPRG